MKLGRSKERQSTAPVELPERSEVVMLSTTTGGQIPARVVERGNNSLVIAITVPTRPLTQAQLDDLVLEYHSARGRIRLRGSFAIDNPNDPDLLRMCEPRAIDVLQQRDYVRIQAARPVVLVGSKSGEHQSFTVDISGGGLLLAGPDTLQIGEEITFRVSLTAGVTPVTGTAKVVRIDPQGRRAVEFVSISDLDRRRLVRFIFELQRNERSRGLRGED
jgi:PilZ domain